MLKESGYLFITSCNWTGDELKVHFQNYFTFVEKLPTPSFSFGGKTGSTVSTLLFKVGKSYFFPKNSIFRMSDTVTVQQLKHAFVIQLSPQASQIERTNSFNLIQSFKSSPTRDQVKVIFELITDSDSKYPFYQFGHF